MDSQLHINNQQTSLQIEGSQQTNKPWIEYNRSKQIAYILPTTVPELAVIWYEKELNSTQVQQII